MGKAKKAISKVKVLNDIDKAILLSDRVQILDVRLMSSSCAQTRLCGPGRKKFEIERALESSMDEATNRIFVNARFTLKTFEVNETNKEPFASIKAEFLLIYNAESLEGINEAAVKSFGEINGVYNAWPYWREYVQNTLIRMGLPPLTIPVFRVFAPEAKRPPKKKVKSKNTDSISKAT